MNYNFLFLQEVNWVYGLGLALWLLWSCFSTCSSE